MNSCITVDLGCERGNNFTNMVTRLENPASAEFLRMFDAVWSDEEKLKKDVTLLSRLDFDFFEVLESVTIALSRKHIQQFYDISDIGTFPERLNPIDDRLALQEQIIKLGKQIVKRGRRLERAASPKTI